MSSNPTSRLRNMSPSPSVHDAPLTPPNPPFSLRPLSTISASTASPSSSKQDLTASLSVNYLPAKFSRPHSPGISYRKANKPGNRKVGGGREAFAAGASRMPGANDEDYDGVQVDGWFQQGGKGKKGKLRWNRFKWILFITNLMLTSYSLCSLIFCLLTWFNVWTNADIVRVGNSAELIVSTVAASMGILTSLVGWSGILLNNRAFISVYNLFLWITFGLLVAPGYMTYKRKVFNLEGKVNAQWSRNLGVQGRLRIQNQLHCCGYFSPFVEATVSQTCYARSTLPGCKGDYLRFQRVVLTRWYAVSFALVPAQLACIVAALLCGNHVTYRFGKGMMPKAYRLNPDSMAVIMDNYAAQLADQYGEEVASDILSRSRSNLDLNTLSYASQSGQQAANRLSSYSSNAGHGSNTGPYSQFGSGPGYGMVRDASDEGKRQ
ncbi:hypothetical protein FRC02_007321 [Tulasnella sp. 418]|nr:hypothetical protein FRC02_007321 [Tulasnella sp. 418]